MSKRTARWRAISAAVRAVLSGSDFAIAARKPRLRSRGRWATVEALQPRQLLSAPAAPSDLFVYSYNWDEAGLAWTDNASDETGYEVQRATDAAFTFDVNTTALSANSTYFSADGLQANVTYYFRVRAANGDGASAYVGVSFVTPWIPPVPDAPGNLSASAASSQQVDLSWSDVGDNGWGYAETQYLIERASDSSFTQDLFRTTVGENVTSYSDTELAPGTSYYYRVYARNDWAWSSPSAGTSVTTFAGNGAAPTVVTPAGVSASPVTGTTAVLSVLGDDAEDGETGLTYTWSVISKPSGAVDPVLSENGDNAAKQTTATFAKTGSYNFRVTLRDSDSMTATSNVSVQVNQTLTSIQVTPASVTVENGTTQQFTASGTDQFGVAMASLPGLVWSVQSGPGTISASGLYTAPTTGTGAASVLASSGGISASAGVTVVQLMPPQAPTNLEAWGDYGGAYIYWTDNSSNETGFEIQRATDINFQFDLATLSAPADSPYFYDYNVQGNIAYYYRARCERGGGFGVQQRGDGRGHSGRSDPLNARSLRDPPEPNGGATGLDGYVRLLQRGDRLHHRAVHKFRFRLELCARQRGPRYRDLLRFGPDARNDLLLPCSRCQRGRAGLRRARLSASQHRKAMARRRPSLRRQAPRRRLWPAQRRRLAYWAPMTTVRRR